MQRCSESIRTLMNQHEWTISPIVQLELQYLNEIGRINPTVDTIIADLSRRAGLTICPKPFNQVITNAMQQMWTRDPFDRILVAYASVGNDILITADENIIAHYPHARW